MKTCLAWIGLLVVMSFVAGCQTTSGSACDGWRAIHPTAGDMGTMSDRLVTEILTHNRHGAQTCGWEAKNARGKK